VSGEPVRVVPASPGQRMLWVLDRHRGGGGMMGVPILLRLRGNLDEAALGSALSELVRRHEALRTTFGLRGRILHQFVGHPEAAATLLRAADLRDVPEPWSAAQFQAAEFLREDPDTTRSPLAVGLWRTAPDEHLLVLNIHHLVTDAWSNMLISRDLSALYSAAVLGEPARLPRIDWQQADHTEWQAGHLAGTVLEDHRTYWREHLKDATFARLPGSAAARRTASAAGLPMAQEWFELSPALIASLTDSARSLGSTLSAYLLTAMAAALRETTGQQNPAFGAVFADRALPQTRQTVGLFANMVVIHAPDHGQDAVSGPAGPGRLADRIHDSVLGAHAHEELPFLLLPHRADRGATGGGAVPENVVFHMLAVPPDAGFETISFAGLEHEVPAPPGGMGSRFEFEVLIVPRPHGLDGVVRYQADRFGAEFIKMFIKLFLEAAQALG